MFCSCHSPWKRLVILAAAALALSWMAAQTPAWAQAPVSYAPPGWDAGLKLAEAPDTNPDPNVVEVAITAKIAEVEVAPGRTVRAWTYNGGLPGPLIRTKVGDRLIVHFVNELDEPTTIHWHGVRVPIEMDGVPGISQDPVKKGESFTYDFVVRDASLYWYHPHVMSAAQVGYGLYGALLVEDPADGVGVADMTTIVLSDIGFDGKGNAGGLGERRVGRHGLRSRRQLRARQRPDPADAARARRRPATLAHREHRQEPFLLPRPRGPGLPGHRAGRRLAGHAHEEQHPAGHARRALRRDRPAHRQARHRTDAARDALQPRLRQHRIPQRRRHHDRGAHKRTGRDEGGSAGGLTRHHAAAAGRRHASAGGLHAATAGRRAFRVPHQRRARTGRRSRSSRRSARRSSGPSRTTPTGTIRSTCTATSSWWSTKRARHSSRWCGRTPSTSR